MKWCPSRPFSCLLWGKSWEPGHSGILPLAEPECAGSWGPGEAGKWPACSQVSFLHARSLSPPVVLQVAKQILAPRAARAAFRRLRSICLLREASGPLFHASRHCFLLCNHSDATHRWLTCTLCFCGTTWMTVSSHCVIIQWTVFGVYNDLKWDPFAVLPTVAAAPDQCVSARGCFSPTHLPSLRFPHSPVRSPAIKLVVSTSYLPSLHESLIS